MMLTEAGQELSIINIGLYGMTHIFKKYGLLCLVNVVSILKSVLPLQQKKIS